jgi:flagellar biosynthesis/type III secretory pathway M-ring protein FliF/YscJ
MSKAKVSVVIDGRSYRPSGEVAAGEGMTGDDILEAIQQNEAYFTRKIEDYLAAWVPEAKVAVTVELDNKTTREQSRIYDAEKTVVKEGETETRSEENTTTAPPSAEPGVAPNTGMSIVGGASGGGSSNTVNEERTKNVVLPSVKEQQIVSGAGMAKVVGAAVRVPRSFFVSTWKRNNPNGKDPDDGLLQPLIDAELPKIRADVMRCTGLTDPEKVSVETYADSLATFAGTGGGAGETASVATGAPSTIGVWASSYGKELAVGALAVVSLFMVTGMVRKGSAPTPALPKAVEPQPVPELHAGEPIAGEVGGGEQALDGIELDDDAVRAQQMLEQVETMVKENPDAAANLVKRWLNRS